MPASEVNTKEITDLTIEAIDAVIEYEDSFARDWRSDFHGEAWRKEFAETKKKATQP
jgi:hypothetical protein